MTPAKELSPELAAKAFLFETRCANKEVATTRLIHWMRRMYEKGRMDGYEQGVAGQSGREEV